MQHLRKLATKIHLLLSEERGETKFDSALQIVMSFVVGAIVLAALVAVFGTDIQAWLKNTVTDWFEVGGYSRPGTSP